MARASSLSSSAFSAVVGRGWRGDGQYPGSGRAWAWTTRGAVLGCESQDPPDLLEEDGVACPVADVEDLEIAIGELGGDKAMIPWNALGISP